MRNHPAHVLLHVRVDAQGLDEPLESSRRSTDDHVAEAFASHDASPQAVDSVARVSASTMTALGDMLDRSDSARCATAHQKR
jgi:hypothetical protein